MNAIDHSLFLLLIFATGFIVNNNSQGIVDDYGPVRERCRVQLGYSREQLNAGRNNFTSVESYLLCLARGLGNLMDNGLINQTRLLANVNPATPYVIAEPTTSCCLNQVYGGKPPPADQVGTYLVRFVTCWKTKVPNLMWDVIGIVTTSVYPPLNQCNSAQNNG